MRRDNRRAINLGEKFNTNDSGVLQIIGWLDNSFYEVRFISTGYITKAKGDKIKLGKVKDKLRPRVYEVGYIGDGEYSCKSHPVLYSRWKHMLARCYSSSYNEHYSDCVVCDRWKNFQHFAYDVQHLPNYRPGLIGLDLDKDTIVNGNRIYGPLTCQFITRAENFNSALGRTTLKDAH